MTLQKNTLFEEQEHHQTQSLERFARDFKQLVLNYSSDFAKQRPYNDNHQESLDNIHENCLNAYKAKINALGSLHMDNGLRGKETRTVREALQEVQEEIGKLRKRLYPDYNSLDAQYALEDYLSNIPKDEPCDEDCIKDIKLAVSYGISFNDINPDFHTLRNDIIDYEATSHYDDYHERRPIVWDQTRLLNNY